MILITQVFLSLQSRPNADMTDFFQFENQREPPSLADRGSLRSGTKSDILQCLQSKVLDMAAVTHMVRSTTSNTFSEYVMLNIIPFMEAQMTDSTELNAVWDNYPEENNLKAMTQQRRGKGPRTKVGDGSTPIPKHDWSGFLKNEENKKELFTFISRQISKNKMRGKLLLTTHFETVLSKEHCDRSTLQLCNHSEADTRILLHLAHAAVQGHTKAHVRTVDSHVVVLFF